MTTLASLDHLRHADTVEIDRLGRPICMYVVPLRNHQQRQDKSSDGRVWRHLLLLHQGLIQFLPDDREGTRRWRFQNEQWKDECEAGRLPLYHHLSGLSHMTFRQGHLWKTKKTNYLNHLDGIELTHHVVIIYERPKCVRRKYPSVFLLMATLLWYAFVDHVLVTRIFESNFEVARPFLG